MQVLAKLLIENHQPTPHYRCLCSVGEGGSTLACQIDCICQRHWSQRMALSMSFWFLFYGICKVACILQMLVEQCTATLGGGALRVAKCISERLLVQLFLSGRDRRIAAVCSARCATGCFHTWRLNPQKKDDSSSNVSESPIKTTAGCQSHAMEDPIQEASPNGWECSASGKHSRTRPGC